VPVSITVATLFDIIENYCTLKFVYGVFGIVVPRLYFARREFSFTLKDDIYVRYLSFADLEEFEKELQKRCPYKIDIGAVFSHRVIFLSLVDIFLWN